MESTMVDGGLTIPSLFRYGTRVHRRSRVLTFDGDGCREATFGEIAVRVERLASALKRVGVEPGEVVGTLMWNTQEHLEAYLAVPSMGAVIHTLNPRLFPQQLAFVINQAADKVLLVHSTVLPLLARLAPELPSVEHVVVVDDGAPVAADAARALPAWSRYEDLMAEAVYEELDWPEIDERSAAIVCYTSGTTGDPKGVVYSHRSTWLHAFAYNNACSMTLSEGERALVVVPMFHVNAWGWPFTGWLVGADLVLPSRYLQGEPLARLIEATGVTISAAVPSILAEVLRYAEAHPDCDLSSLKALLCGGSALPPSLLEGFDRLGIRVLQGWGMTETSPVCAISGPPGDAEAAAAGDGVSDAHWRLKTGRVVPGVELRVMTAEGVEAEWDGVTTGEIEVRGPWVTGSYFGSDSADRFRDGWLRTGDIGTVDDRGYLQITDRLKDVIKSGGEWISSVELENELMGHPDVVEASVVGVSDDRWGERPLAVVVLRDGAAVGPDELCAWLAGRVARWWLPERWAQVDSVPKTSVGKFDKRVLRAAYAAGELDVVTVDRPPTEL